MLKSAKELETKTRREERHLYWEWRKVRWRSQCTVLPLYFWLTNIRSENIVQQSRKLVEGSAPTRSTGWPEIIDGSRVNQSHLQLLSSLLLSEQNLQLPRVSGRCWVLEEQWIHTFRTQCLSYLMNDPSSINDAVTYFIVSCDQNRLCWKEEGVGSMPAREQ